MPNSRLLKILASLAGVLVVLALFIFYRQVPHGVRPYAKAIAKSDTVLIHEGASEVELDLQGKEWKLRQSRGGWVDPESDKVKTLLSSLQELQVEDEISDRPERAPDFDVTGASGTRVTLKARGTTVADGIFGKQAPDFAHIYFRFPDGKSVYLARGVIRGEVSGANVNAWRSRQLLNIPEAKVQSISIEGKGFKTNLVRSSDTWTLNGVRTEPGPIYTLVGALAHLRASDFVDTAQQPDLSFDSLTWAHIHLVADTTSADLFIGPQVAASHNYPVATSKESSLAWISEAQASAIIRKPSDLASGAK